MQNPFSGLVSYIVDYIKRGGREEQREYRRVNLTSRGIDAVIEICLGEERVYHTGKLFNLSPVGAAVVSPISLEEKTECRLMWSYDNQGYSIQGKIAHSHHRDQTIGIDFDETITDPEMIQKYKL